VSYGVYRGDAETIRHGGVGGTAAALAENAQFPRLPDDVPHHQEKSRESEPADDAQFVLELTSLGLIEHSPTLTGSALDTEPEERIVGMTFGDWEMGQGRPHPCETEVAPMGYLLSCLETFLPCRPAASHVIRGEESPAAVGQQQTLARCFREGEICAERSKHVMDETTFLVDVARILGDDPGYVERLGEIHQQIGKLSFRSAPFMALNLDREAIAKHFPPFGKMT
jgi:hypothetical protein